MLKRSEVLSDDRFYMQWSCNPFIKDYTEVFYTIYERNIPST